MPAAALHLQSAGELKLQLPVPDSVMVMVVLQYCRHGHGSTPEYTGSTVVLLLVLRLLSLRLHRH